MLKKFNFKFQNPCLFLLNELSDDISLFYWGINVNFFKSRF